MKTFVKHLIALFFWFAFWFRYKITIKGMEKLTPEALKKPGGVLFLPNHPCVFVDPTVVTLAVWPKFPIRPMIVEYQYYMKGINWLMRYLDALPVPNFTTSSNSLKRKKTERVMARVIEGLRTKENFLIYPSGKTKLTGYEAVGGASAVHFILSNTPEANVVLVRTKGLWGSSFSRAITGKVPFMFPMIWEGMKHVFKNLLFFTPRREIIIELEPAPADFPWKASRMELNRYLEAWYNKPDGLSKQQGEYPGDSLMLIPYSFWNKEVPKIGHSYNLEDKNIDLSKISDAIKQKITHKIAELTQTEQEKVTPELNLATDLGMDSLDIAEVSAFLQDKFDIPPIPFTELTTVGKLMAIAARQVVCKEEVEEEEVKLAKWKVSRGPRERLYIGEGKTIPEVFLRICDKFGDDPAVADMRTGVLTYKNLKMRVLLIADYIKKLPGNYIGIMLPASVGAEILVLATQIAGKIPLMINWTIGPRHVESVKALSNVQVVLSSWSFIDRLENINLDGIEDNIIMLEDVRHEFGPKKMLNAFMQSRKSADELVQSLEINRLKPSDPAVLLFTSGSESMPKGVPLSHYNILSNQKALLEGIEVYNDDVLLGMLPPFHSFGFTITGLLAMTAGIKTAYSPDPTNGKRLLKAIELFDCTIMGGTPTFIKAIMKAAKPEQFTKTRICFTGAEKAPPELFQLMKDFGKEDFLLEGYGITECSPVLTFNRYKQRHSGVGKPANGIEICIVHPETHVLQPVGSQGLILARGPSIFSGYINPGLSSPFIELNGKQWYKTGDLGFLDDEGFLTISGRLKRFVKIGAEMISLAAIEDALLQAGVKKNWFLNAESGPSLAVCAKEIAGEKTRLFLFTTLNVSLEEFNQTLKETGFSNLIKFSNIQKLDEIPVMGTGKTNYRLLENEFLSKLDDKKDYQPTTGINSDEFKDVYYNPA